MRNISEFAEYFCQYQKLNSATVNILMDATEKICENSLSLKCWNGTGEITSFYCFLMFFTKNKKVDFSQLSQLRVSPQAFYISIHDFS